MIALDKETAAKFTADSEAVREALGDAFCGWIKTRPEGTVYIAAAVNGSATISGRIAAMVDNGAHRNDTVAGAIITLIMNSGCDAAKVLATASHIVAMNSEVAGHA